MQRHTVHLSVSQEVSGFAPARHFRPTVGWVAAFPKAPVETRCILMTELLLAAIDRPQSILPLVSLLAIRSRHRLLHNQGCQSISALSLASPTRHRRSKSNAARIVFNPTSYLSLDEIDDLRLINQSIENRPGPKARTRTTAKRKRNSSAARNLSGSLKSPFTFSRSAVR